MSDTYPFPWHFWRVAAAAQFARRHCAERESFPPQAPAPTTLGIFPAKAQLSLRSAALYKRPRRAVTLAPPRETPALRLVQSNRRSKCHIDEVPFKHKPRKYICVLPALSVSPTCVESSLTQMDVLATGCCRHYTVESKAFFFFLSFIY